MAENIVYPNGGYGIMPNDAFNKYLRFQNQRRATTGMGATPADQKAFWEGTMDSVVKGASSRAAQNLEQKRLNSTIDYQNKQLEQADKARESSMYAGLAQYPMTYLMYDALGFGRDKKTKSKLGGLWDWATQNRTSSAIPSMSALDWADIGAADMREGSRIDRMGSYPEIPTYPTYQESTDYINPSLLSMLDYSPIVSPTNYSPDIGVDGLTGTVPTMADNSFIPSVFSFKEW